jgi:hypothetical protein
MIVHRKLTPDWYFARDLITSSLAKNPFAGWRRDSFGLTRHQLTLPGEAS